MEPTLRQLRHFLLVAGAGGFRLAAEKAYRSQSALSASIKELEQAVGGPLFEPGRHAVLSALGRRCLPIAEDMVARFDQQTKALRGIAEPTSLTLAVLPSFAARWLPGFIERYRDRHPDVALRILDDNSRNIAELVASGRADLGILGYPTPDRRFTHRELARDRFGLICHRRHPLAGRTSVPWSALVDQPMLGNLTHRQLAGLSVARYVEAPRLFVANVTSLLALVDAGGWVTALPVLAVPPRETRVVAVPLARPTVTRRIALIRPRNARRHAAAEAAEAVLDDVIAR